MFSHEVILQGALQTYWHGGTVYVKMKTAILDSNKYQMNAAVAAAAKDFQVQTRLKGLEEPW